MGGDATLVACWAGSLDGYTFLQFFEGSSHAGYFGGGFDCRWRRGRAIRVEVRDVVPSRLNAHYWAIRIGVAGR